MIDIYTINEDGNLLDAAGIGAILALKNAEIPKYDEEEDKIIYEESSGKKLPVKKEIPLSLTFHKLGDSIIIDPTREEEDVSDVRITIGSSEAGISSMQKGNEFALSEEEMFKIIDSLDKVRKDLRSKIEKYLK